MRKLRLVAVLLLLSLMIPACTTSGPVLQWNGHGLEGLPFAQKDVGEVTVHYAAGTTADNAAKVADAAHPVTDKDAFRTMARLGADERIHLWLVPAGTRWPAGLPAIRTGRYRAAAPRIIVGQAPANDKDDFRSGLPEAVALSSSQEEGSPAYSTDWLHDGMGAALALNRSKYPTDLWSKLSLGASPAMLQRLEHPEGEDPAAYREAAGALAGLVMDRWGVNWWRDYPRQGDQLKPSAMLLWATGATDRKTALARWEERAASVRETAQRSRAIILSAADSSPVRVQPQLDRLPKGPGPNDNYSPHGYDISVRYDPAAHTVGGDERLSWHNGEGTPVDTLYFNLWPNVEQYSMYGGRISIEAVAVDGKEVAFTARGLDLTVPLGRSVATGEKAAVSVRFTTHIPKGETARAFGQDGAARFVLAHWFPILAVLDDRGWNLTPLPEAGGEPYSENAQFRVTLDVPAGTVVGATGHQERREEQGDRWRYVYNAPDVKDWVAIGGTSLAEYTTDAGSAKLHIIYAKAAWDRAWAERVAPEVQRAMALFSEKFGPYPYRDLVVACCAGLEYPGFFFTTEEEAGGLWRVVTYHELGHQWFYGAVGNDQYMEPWLDEGFTRYAEQLAVRTFGPPEQRGNYATTELPAGVPLLNSDSGAFYYHGRYAAVYDYGARTLDELETTLGTPVFTRVMHEWVRQYQFKTATAGDFVRVAQTVSGKDLSGFFHDHHVDPALRAPYHPALPLGETRPRM